MPRHHIVAQMYLRRFAASNERLVMVSRDNMAASHRVTVNNACNEVGFYEFPTDDLEAQARMGHNPELVEEILAQIEGESNTY